MMHPRITTKICTILATGMLITADANAADTISVKRMSMELAADVARAAVEECRKRGYQVTAVVVDRNGIAQVTMRDVLANRFTLQIAEEKANSVILSGVSSSEFRKNRADIRQEMNHVAGIVMLEGGMPIWAGGALLGAVGGDIDEACARKAVESVQERLDFVD